MNDSEKMPDTIINSIGLIENIILKVLQMLL